MTQPVDVISQNVGENVRREQARDLAATVVQAIFRLIKAATLHAADNQAVVRQVEETASVIQDFGHRSGYNASILFARGSVFVSGQLLKANRSVYEGALELAEILERCGYSELGISRDVRPADLTAFATAVAEALRSGRVLPDRPAPNVRLRAVGDAVLQRETAVDRIDDEAEAMVRAYATAIVIMRRFYDDLRRGRYALRQSMKRVAQRLVDLSAGETPAFLGVTALRNQNSDEAGRAVNTAILSLAMARQVTSDVVQLGRIGMAALLFDTARPRLAGVVGRDEGTIIPELSDQQDAEVPAGTAAVLTALGLVNEPSVMRTVIAYEGHWVRRQGALGPLYRGLRQPTLQARIVAVARAFNDLLTPQPGEAPPAADEAIAALEQAATDPAERTVLRLLVGALGLFPTGTLVELSTGEVALVVQTPSHPARYSQPRVRLVLDAVGGSIQRPVEIDLAERPRPGEPARHIRRVVATSDDPAAASMRAHAVAPEPAPASVRLPAATLPEEGLARPPVHPSSATIAARPQAIEAAARAQHTPTRAPPPDPAQPDPRAAAPTVRPGRRTAAPEEPSLQPPPVPRVEPFAQAASFSPARERHPNVTVEIPPPRSTPAPQRAPVDEPDVHGQVTRPTWAEVADPPPSPEPEEPPSSELPGLLQLPSIPPTAEGALTRTPLVHLLVYMLDRRLTGTTCFVDPGGFVHGIYFNDGTPAKVWTGTMVAPLDRVILDLGLLDEKTLRDSLKEISRRRVLHGRHLVDKGLLDRETLLTVLRHQLVRKLIALFDLPPETRYAYFDGMNLLDTFGGRELLECEPLSVVMAGVRLHADSPIVDSTLDRIAHRPLGLHLDADPKRFQLHRDEAAVVDLLRTRRMVLAELISAGVAQERVVRLTVYALAITRHLDLGMPGRGPIGIGRERVASPLIDAGPAGARPGPTGARTGPQRDRPAPPSRPMRAVAPASNPTTPTPRTTRSNVADLGHTPAAPAVTVVAGDDAPPPSRRTGAQAAAGPDSVAMPRGVEARGPNSPRTLASPGARAGRTTEPMPPSSRPKPAAPPDPKLAARRAEIEARAATIDDEDFFQVLGVTADAGPERIRGNYFALAKQWHPDRVPAELEDVKPLVARVFARVSEAYQTLTDPERRAKYEQAMQEGTPEDEEQKVARAVDAAMEFQKAEVLLKKRDLATAEALAQRAVDADPEEPEYLTLLTWIQAQRRGDPPPFPEGGTSAHFGDLILILDAILVREPRYERALFYRGSLLKRTGYTEKALADFRLAAEINPRNLDAVREVRLAEMRKRSGPEQPPPQGGGGGLLGKIWKR